MQAQSCRATKYALWQARQLAEEPQADAKGEVLNRSWLGSNTRTCSLASTRLKSLETIRWGYREATARKGDSKPTSLRSSRRSEPMSIRSARRARRATIRARCRRLGFPTSCAFVIPKGKWYPELVQIWIEVKRPGEEMSGPQAVFRLNALKAGCNYVVGGVDEVLAWLKARGVVK